MRPIRWLSRLTWGVVGTVSEALSELTLSHFVIGTRRVPGSGNSTSGTLPTAQLRSVGTAHEDAQLARTAAVLFGLNGFQ